MRSTPERYGDFKPKFHHYGVVAVVVAGQIYWSDSLGHFGVTPAAVWEGMEIAQAMDIEKELFAHYIKATLFDGMARDWAEVNKVVVSKLRKELRELFAQNSTQDRFYIHFAYGALNSTLSVSAHAPDWFTDWVGKQKMFPLEREAFVDEVLNRLSAPGKPNRRAAVAAAKAQL